MHWDRRYRVDWHKLQHIIAHNLNTQIKMQSNVDRVVEVVRTSVFTSLRSDTPIESKRKLFFESLYRANYELTCLTTEGEGEKCVDVSVAVEMVSMAYVPDAYDIAVCITGDIDLKPAMRKTRSIGKRVTLCSLRNSCNAEFMNPEHQIRDFDIIWLDDYIDEIIVPNVWMSGGTVPMYIYCVIYLLNAF